MRMARALVCATVFAVTWGCLTTERPAPEGPLWRTQSELIAQPGKFVSGMGDAAPPGDEETLTRRAEHVARAKLGDAGADYVRSVLAEFLHETGVGVDPDSTAAQEFVAAMGAETSNAILRQSLRHDTWRDPHTGVVHVLYRVPVSFVNNRLLEAFRTDLIWARLFRAGTEDVALARLTRLLNERLKAVVSQVPPEMEEPPQIGQPPPEDEPENPPPEWLLLGRHKRYPVSSFVTATGVGESRSAAGQNSRAELTRQIAGRMATERLALIAVRPDSGIARNLLALRPADLGFQNDVLTADRVAGTWYDTVTDTYYVMWAVDRRVAADTWRLRARNALRDAGERLASARNHHKADNHLTAARDYFEALGGLQRAVKWQLAAIAVDPERTEETAGLDPQGLLPPAQAGLAELIGELALRKVSGNNQWSARGVALREPLVVALVAGDEERPVSGALLRFSFTAGEGRLAEHIQTGADGQAVCTVEEVARSDQALGRIECTLDLAELASGLDFAEMQVPSVSFHFVGRTRRNTHLALFVDGRDTQGEPVGTHTVRAGLAAALREAEFTLLDPDTVQGRAALFRAAGDAPEEEVVRAFAGLGRELEDRGFLLVAVGKASPRIVERAQTRQGVLYFAHTEVVVRVIDPSLPRDRTVLTVTADGKEAFLDNPSEALERSRVKAAELCSRRLIQALEGRLGAE